MVKTDPYGFIASPNYPNNYFTNSFCKLEIRVPATAIIVLIYNFGPSLNHIFETHNIYLTLSDLLFIEGDNQDDRLSFSAHHGPLSYIDIPAMAEETEILLSSKGVVDSITRINHTQLFIFPSNTVDVTIRNAWLSSRSTFVNLKMCSMNADDNNILIITFESRGFKLLILVGQKSYCEIRNLWIKEILQQKMITTIKLFSLVHRALTAHSIIHI
uniref:CUB domain-containing protein n=1 Tax=Heterorhabditis bacteriophora TaxID=37862 RepID=A0A1I7WPF8_HETBA